VATGVAHDANVFERFTDRARRVIVLAQEEARLLNHNYIGTEHLLLGLIAEGEGVAATALERMGVDLGTVRRQVEEIIGHGEKAQSGHIPFTPRAKKVLELSLREALQLGHNYIGTEHILLGLVREGEGVAAQVLQKLGLQLQRTRDEVLALLSGSTGARQVLPPTEAMAAAGPSVPALRWRVVRALDRLSDLETQVRAIRDELAEVRRLLALFAPEGSPEAPPDEAEGGGPAPAT
jgi:ATP-dependent Clp protease ATP-binding subunit ClpC